MTYPSTAYDHGHYDPLRAALVDHYLEEEAKAGGERYGRLDRARLSSDKAETALRRWLLAKALELDAATG